MPQILQFHIDKSLFKDEQALLNMADDLRILNNRGLHLVITFGEDHKVPQVLAEHGQDDLYMERYRVLSDEGFQVYLDHFIDTICPRLERILSLANIPVYSLCALKPSVFRLRKRFHTQLDLGWIGEIREVNKDLLAQFIIHKQVPVISPFGLGYDDNFYALEPTECTLWIASSIASDKLLILMETDSFWHKIVGREKDPESSEHDVIRAVTKDYLNCGWDDILEEITRSKQTELDGENVVSRALIVPISKVKNPILSALKRLEAVSL